MEINAPDEYMILLEDHAALTLNGFQTKPTHFPCIGIIRVIDGERTERFVYTPSVVASFSAMEGWREGSAEGMKRLIDELGLK